MTIIKYGGLFFFFNKMQKKEVMHLGEMTKHLNCQLKIKVH